MKREEAKEQLNELKKTFNTLLFFESVTVGDKKEFLKKNIKALDAAFVCLENERPKGKWIIDGAIERCSYCSGVKNQLSESFCANCGAEMDRDLCNFNPMTGEEEPMNEDCRKTVEALDIAIKTLEQEPIKE